MEGGAGVATRQQAATCACFVRVPHHQKPRGPPALYVMALCRPVIEGNIQNGWSCCKILRYLAEMRKDNGLSASCELSGLCTLRK